MHKFLLIVLPILFLLLAIIYNDVEKLITFDWGYINDFNDVISMLYLLPNAFSLIIKFSLINLLGIFVIICK